MMIRRTIYAVLFSIACIAALFMPRSGYGWGHDGFYFGAGALTIPMVTPAHRLTVPGGSSERVHFRPGFGAWLLFGYDFPESRWGIQVPLEWHYFNLNREEWIHSMGGTVEGVVRLVEWDNGFDFHLVGGVGATHLFEGKINNNSHCTGMHFEVGPGFSWFFARGDIKASLTMEVPIRAIYFFGDHLSRGGTFVFAFPVRLGFTVGF